MSRVWRLLPPRKSFVAASSSRTRAPARRAQIAAHNPALPPPTTRTSKDCFSSMSGFHFTGRSPKDNSERRSRLFNIDISRSLYGSPIFLHRFSDVTGLFQPPHERIIDQTAALTSQD